MQRPRAVAIVGASNGAGTTTLTAHLAAALVHQQRPAIAFDLSPDNALRLFLGMPWNEADGLAPRLLDGSPWHEAAYRSAAGVDFLPFGQLESEDEVDRVQDWFAAHPGWLASRLREIRLAPEGLFLIDCPRTPAAVRDQALAAADLLLLVVRPTPIAYAAAMRLLRGIRAQGGPPTTVVLTGFDSSRSLDRDMALLLRTSLGDQLCPVSVHRDEAIREALASKQTVFDYHPASQAAHDFAALATWTLAHLGHLREHA